MILFQRPTSKPVANHGFFGVVYSTTLWNGSQTASYPTKPVLLGSFLRVVINLDLPSGTGGFSLGRSLMIFTFMHLIQ